MVRTLREKLASQRAAFLEAKARAREASSFGSGSGFGFGVSASQRFNDDFNYSNAKMPRDGGGGEKVAFVDTKKRFIVGGGVLLESGDAAEELRKRERMLEKKRAALASFQFSPSAVSPSSSSFFLSRRSCESVEEQYEMDSPPPPPPSYAPPETTPDLTLRPPHSPFHSHARDTGDEDSGILVDSSEFLAVDLEAQEERMRGEETLVAALEREIASLKESVEHQTARANGAEKEIEQLKVQAEDAAIDAIALRAEVAAGRAQVTSSENLVAELRADAETQQSNESASNRALMEQCVKKDASIAALQIKIGDQAADIEKLRLDLASATEALSSSRRRIEGKEKTIREGASLIGELNAEKLHASNDKAKLEAELAASADVIAKLRRDLEIANEKEMEDKLAYESMRDRAKRDNERAAQQSAASRDALDSALGDLEEARQEAAQAHERVESLSAQLMESLKSDSAEDDDARDIQIARLNEMLGKASAVSEAQEKQVEFYKQIAEDHMNLAQEAAREASAFQKLLSQEQIRFKEAEEELRRIADEQAAKDAAEFEQLLAEEKRQRKEVEDALKVESVDAQTSPPPPPPPPSKPLSSELFSDDLLHSTSTLSSPPSSLHHASLERPSIPDGSRRSRSSPAHSDGSIVIDVDLAKGRVRQIVVPEDGDPDEIANSFGKENGLDGKVVRRLSAYISQEIERSQQQQHEENNNGEVDADVAPY